MAQPNAQSATFELAPDLMLTCLTWLTFFGLLWILKRFAFKPTLEALQKREDYVRQSLLEADQARAQLANIDKEKEKILEQARTTAAQIVQESRQTASAVAADIESQAKRHAHDIVESAKAQIEGERQHVSALLKREAVETAIQLAQKVLHANLDIEKNKHLVEEAIRKDMS